MIFYQILSAVGPDRPGLVAQLTDVLFRRGCNLEESAMMRLGSEFGIQLIFTSRRPVLPGLFDPLRKKLGLTIHIKTINKKLATAHRSAKSLARITLHGYDRPGLVHKLTQLLAKHRFNITDLATHRTKGKIGSGYVLFIEGEISPRAPIRLLERALSRLGSALKVTVRITPVSSATL
jgi:glycine cleavage system transcriptional repressor